jgi:RNA polymerase sigma factor (sigma-70 family)
VARTISVPLDGRAARARVSKPLLALRGDEHLVDQLRRGNELAFEVIYERHVTGILSFCRHMLGSREEGEDAVQHAFAAAHRDLLRDDREIRLKPWLYAIARNRCLSLLRARREQPDDALETGTEGLDDEVQRRADLRELVADLQDLPADQRAALVLSELRDLSHADVAEALGCQVGNVKGLVFRARAGLIERREARGAACEEIQQELSSARGGALRRGKLRHHLRACPACSGYLEEVRSQRKMMALILPVVPTVGLKQGVLAAVGIGGGASGGGGAAAGGGLLAAALPATGATVAKVAVVGALVGGAGVAGEATIDRDQPPPSSPPALTPDVPANALRSPLGAAEVAEASDEPVAAGERRARAVKEKRRKARRRARGRAKGIAAGRPEKAPANAGKKAKPPKKLPGYERPPESAPARGLPPERPVRPEPAAPVKPLREPKEKVVAKPAPTDRSRRIKPAP